MKLDNEDKMLIGAGVLALGTLGFFWYKNKKKNEVKNLDVSNEVVEPIKIPESATPSYNGSANTTGKDIYKVLKFGSKGTEVKALQIELKVKGDGKFGNETLTALQKARGVHEISLHGFFESKPIKENQTETVKVLPKKGAKLMAIVGGTNIFFAKKLANGALINSGEKGLFSSFAYGDEVGNFVRNHANGYYLITSKGKYYFVKAENVKPF